MVRSEVVASGIRRSALLGWLFLVTFCAGNLQAQADATIGGYVYDRFSGEPISALVELEGYGSRVSSDAGEFRFPSVALGGKTIRVSALGYASETLSFELRGDTLLAVRLLPTAVVLDTLVTAPRLVDLRGGVRDRERGFGMVGAEVFTSDGQFTRSNAHGDFRLKEVLEGLPIQLSIRSFGYMPLDSVVIPSADGRYAFTLAVDPTVEALISGKVIELEARAAPRFAPLFRNLNRDELLQFAGSHTLQSILEFRFPLAAERLTAVVIDGRRSNMTGDPMLEVSHLLPEELERIEFFYAGRKAVTLIVYTREYMRTLIARDLQ